MLTKTLWERFADKFVVGPECWDWVGAQNAKGYGKPNHRGTNLYAHRVAYEMFVGEIPKGFDIDHLCRNHSCVRPSHLEAVTRRTNLMRGETVAAANAAKSHCRWGHEFTPTNTYRHAGRRYCRECGRAKQRRYRQAAA